MSRLSGFFEAILELWDVVDSSNRTLCVYCGSHKLIEEEHFLPKCRGGATTVLHGIS